MARIVHIALKVEDLEGATKFYEDLFGFRQTGTGYARGHVSRHMTDGAIDVALMLYDNEEVEEAQLSGPGPCIHHWGIEVDDKNATAKLIEQNGGKIISKPEEGALKFRAPNGTIAEIVRAGRYKTVEQSDQPRIVRLAIEVQDIDASVQFYENVFGFKEIRRDNATDSESQLLTDGQFEVLLMSTSRSQKPSKIHHIGIAVFDPKACAERIALHGGAILSGPEASALRYRAPDGTMAELLDAKLLHRETESPMSA